MHLFDKATFSSKSFELKVNVEPGQHNVAQVSLHHRVLCIESLEWRYSIDPHDKRSQESNYGWPKQPLQVTIDGCCSNETSSPQSFKPPIVKRDRVEVKVYNPSALPVTLAITVTGTLATPGENYHVSDQELQGYCMLDDNARGMLALQAASDSLHSLGSAEAQTQALPLPQEEPKALAYERPTNELKSLMIGDLMQSKIDIKDVIALTDYLLDKGWSR